MLPFFQITVIGLLNEVVQECFTLLLIGDKGDVVVIIEEQSRWRKALIQTMMEMPEISCGEIGLLTQSIPSVIVCLGGCSSVYSWGSVLIYSGSHYQVRVDSHPSSVIRAMCSLFVCPDQVNLIIPPWGCPVTQQSRCTSALGEFTDGIPDCVSFATPIIWMFVLEKRIGISDSAVHLTQ